jgi:hypothetical protein
MTLLLLTVDIQPGTPHPGALPGTPYSLYPWLCKIPFPVLVDGQVLRTRGFAI